MIRNEYMLILACKAYENQLMKLMSEEDFSKFSKALSIEIFKAEVESWNDGDYKQFVLEHLDEICSEDYNAYDFYQKYPKKFNQSPWEAWGVQDPEEGDELEEI